MPDSASRALARDSHHAWIGSEALEQLAQQGRPGITSDETTTITFTIDGLVVHCERDDKIRTLILQQVIPAASGGHEL